MKACFLMAAALLAATLACRVGGNQPITATDDEAALPIAVPPRERPLPGQEPEEPPEFDVSIEVPPGREGEYPLIISVRERHGYYVETFHLQIRKKASPFALELFYDRYLKAGEVLVLHERLVPAELPNFGGDMGTSDDWEGVVTHYGRARKSNPDTVPSGAGEP